jgi:hypothetical protein
MRLNTTSCIARPFFTEPGLNALRVMAADRRLVNPGEVRPCPPGAPPRRPNAGEGGVVPEKAGLSIANRASRRTRKLRQPGRAVPPRFGGDLVSRLSCGDPRVTGSDRNCVRIRLGGRCQQMAHRKAIASRRNVLRQRTGLLPISKLDTDPQ